MGGRRGREEEPKSANVNLPLRVSLRQLYLGDLLDVSFARQVMCTEHAKCSKNCPDCQGPGVKVQTHQLAPGFVQQVQVYFSFLFFFLLFQLSNCNYCHCFACSDLLLLG